MANNNLSYHTIDNSIHQFNDEQNNIIREILDDQADECILVGYVIKMRTDEIKDSLMSSAYDLYTSNLTRERKKHVFQRAPIGQKVPKYVYSIVGSLERHDKNVGGGCNRFVIDWFLEGVFKGWGMNMNQESGIWENKLTLVRMHDDNRSFDSKEITRNF